jgi:hypothetical protein
MVEGGVEGRRRGRKLARLYEVLEVTARTLAFILEEWEPLEYSES